MYHESPSGEVVCLSAKTGEKIWGLNFLKEFEGENITWALAESLLIDGEHLICCPGGKGPTWPHPVVCGGRLYLRHGDLLFAYDIRAKQ